MISKAKWHNMQNLIVHYIYHLFFSNRVSVERGEDTLKLIIDKYVFYLRANTMELIVTKKEKKLTRTREVCLDCVDDVSADKLARLIANIITVIVTM